MNNILERISDDEIKLSAEGKSKTFPFTYEGTLQAREIIVKRKLKVEIEPSLKEWIKDQTRLRKGEWSFNSIDINTNLGTALSRREFQRVGVKFIGEHKCVLIADEPGLGKTIQTISAIIESGCSGSILVVAPKTAVYVTWPKELTRWLSEVAPYDEWVTIGGDMSKLQRLRAVKKVLQWDMGKGRIGPRQWVVTSPNYLRLKPKVDASNRYVYDEDKEKIITPVREAIPALLAIEWAAVIVDEAHQTLSGASANIKNQSAQRQGLGLLSIKEDGLQIALSGTPFRGKHENLWGVLNWLFPTHYKAYWSWVRKHFYVYQETDTNQQKIGELKSETKLAYELQEVMLRRTKLEVAKDLPRKRYGGTPLFDRGPIAVWLEMSAQQAKAYRSMAAEAMVELEGGTLMPNGILAEMMRLKQFANSYGFIGGDDTFYPTFPSNKFDWIVQFLKDRGIDGSGPGESKVVIGSQFTKLLLLFEMRLREQYKIETFCLTGKTSNDKRLKFQQAFQTNSMELFGEPDKPSPDVFLTNTIAGGTSIDLDAADDIIIIDSTFNSDDQEQLEDRIHRISRAHNVTVWSLASTKSIDESILRDTHDMNMSIKQILDGERGIDFAKQLLRDSL